MTAYAKAMNAETREIRLVRINPAVRRMLASHDTHWAKRSNGKGGFVKVDVLIISSSELWFRLLPYFEYEVEKNLGKHRAEKVEE